jgi:two-component system, chemotaxis family, sensor kinase CheA
MALVFDISQDELPIFMAETEEHLQVLDENLIKLERQANDAELLQAIFRAAHTLKGTAGMIGHKRLVALTHRLETAFDGIRKGTLAVTTSLVDVCLEAVDALRLLRDEVVSGEQSDVDVPAIVNKFTLVSADTGPVIQQAEQAKKVVQPVKPDGAESLPKMVISNGKHALAIEAAISPDSIASAARAFQLMLAIQELGKVLDMDPPQVEIETARPVAFFKAVIETQESIEKVKKTLNDISEIVQLNVQEKKVDADQPSAPEMPDILIDGKEIPRLSEFLIQNGYITQGQLNKALEIQRSEGQEKDLFGQLLVKMGVISHNSMERAIAEFIQQQRATIQKLSTVPDRSRAKVGDMTVRTSVERLDNLMNLVGELITDRNRLYKIRDNFEISMRGNEQTSILGETVSHVSRITDQLQEEVMRIRMVPISNVFNKFPRMVRDLSQLQNKDIEFVVKGEDTELDRSLIQEINDPLIHLLRNAVDHGIESPSDRFKKGKPGQGLIQLSARHEQGQIILTVEDDGNGIDTERLKASSVSKGYLTEAEAANLSNEKAIDLIFQSGVSTAKKVTDISGRGVGMDIVRNNIERINGSIVVSTEKGSGTKFQIVLPLTLAIVPTMLVRVGTIPFAIPLMMIIETTRITQQEIQTVRGIPVIRLRNHVLPLMNLADVFGVEQDGERQKHTYVVVVTSNKVQVGLMVDSLVGEEEVVVKSLGSFIGQIPGISSAAILGDGQVALIVDVAGLYKVANIA